MSAVLCIVFAFCTAFASASCLQYCSCHIVAGEHHKILTPGCCWGDMASQISFRSIFNDCSTLSNFRQVRNSDVLYSAIPGQVQNVLKANFLYSAGDLPGQAFSKLFIRLRLPVHSNDLAKRQVSGRPCMHKVFGHRMTAFGRQKPLEAADASACEWQLTCQQSGPSELT